MDRWLQYVATWLRGYVVMRPRVNRVTRLSGYMGVLLLFWLLGATWRRTCMAMWLPSHVAA